MFTYFENGGIIKLWNTSYDSFYNFKVQKNGDDLLWN